MSNNESKKIKSMGRIKKKLESETISLGEQEPRIVSVRGITHISGNQSFAGIRFTRGDSQTIPFGLNVENREEASYT